MEDRIVLDVEIQKCIGQDGLTWDDTDKLGVACAVVYEFNIDRFRVYGPKQEELLALRQRILNATRVSGYNIWKFDLPVVWTLNRDAFVASPISDVLLPKNNDLLRRIWASLGYDPDVFNASTHGSWGLDCVARGTLGKGKIANGAQAPQWFQQGQLGRCINYCVDDVALERDLAVFVDRYGYVVNGNTGQVVQVTAKAGC